MAAAKKAKKEASEKVKEETTAQPTVVEVKPAIKYPMEDLSLDAGALSKRELVARPPAHKETSVPQDLFESVIMAWQFLNTFG